jgi:hypothetical protein
MPLCVQVNLRGMVDCIVRVCLREYGRVQDGPYSKDAWLDPQFPVCTTNKLVFTTRRSVVQSALEGTLLLMDSLYKGCNPTGMLDSGHAFNLFIFALLQTLISPYTVVDIYVLSNTSDTHLIIIAIFVQAAVACLVFKGTCLDSTFYCSFTSYTTFRKTRPVPKHNIYGQIKRFYIL